MQEFVKPLTYIEGRPCVSLDNGLIAMLDTGAKIPVWTAGAEVLKEYYPEAELIIKNIDIGLLQGKAMGAVYKITFRLNSLTFPNMLIFVIDDEVEYTVLMSNTMFIGLELRLDQYRDTMHVIIPDGESCIRNIRFKLKGKDIVLFQD